MFYGDTGEGKSASVLASCPTPCLYVKAENRGVSVTIEVANEIRKSKGLPLLNNDTMKMFEYANLDDFLDFVCNKENWESWCKCVIIDSLSFIMNIHLMRQVIDDRIDNSSKKIKLEDEYKQQLAGWGTLAEIMNRISNDLGLFVNAGIPVVCICLTEECESKIVGKPASILPLLSGNKYGLNMPGFFDLIGYVKCRTIINKDAAGKDVKRIQYPPKVSFDKTNHFLAKWTGVGDQRVFDLDLEQILKIKDKEG